MIPLGHYLLLSAVLFAIGTAGVFLRRNLITILLSIEIMLNAVNLTFVAFGRSQGAVDGQIITFFVMTVAAAEAAGVACQSVAVTNNLPCDAIIQQAKKHKCDLIMMASHGRKGLSSVLLGSETAKVLTHSKIPVLVVR